MRVIVIVSERKESITVTGDKTLGNAVTQRETVVPPSNCPVNRTPPEEPRHPRKLLTHSPETALNPHVCTPRV